MFHNTAAKTTKKRYEDKGYSSYFFFALSWLLLAEFARLIY